MAGAYLDNNATTKVDPRVVEAMLPFFIEAYGNASSIHAYGQVARAAVEEARQTVARLLGARAQEIVFTAGGTEADNTAVMGVARANSEKGKHLVTTSIEHPAVLKACAALKSEGFEVTELEVGSDGVVDLEKFAAALRPDTILASVMHANNELGTLQPLAEVSKICRERSILLHSDAVQTVAKIPVSVDSLGVDLLSLSAHKFHGPKGVGALYVRQGVRFAPASVGGSHERGRRAGTENVPGIVGLGKACQLTGEGIDEFSRRVLSLRDRLENRLLEVVPDVEVNGSRRSRMPHVTNLSFAGIEGEALLIALDFQGIAVSTGAACSSGSLEPSHVLRAMKLPRHRIQGAIRFSLSRLTTTEEIDYVLEVVPAVVDRIRQMGLKKRH